MDSTSFWMARKCPFARLRKRAAQRRRYRARASSLRPAGITTTNPLWEPLRERPAAKTEPRRSESLSSIYFAAGGDVALDGGNIACGLRRLSPVAGIGA